MSLPTLLKYAVEDRIATFDFSPKLAIGETLSTAAVTPAAGVTASPGAINAGGYLVTSVLSGGAVPNDYPVACEAETSAGRTLKIVVVLEVRDDAN